METISYRQIKFRLKNLKNDDRVLLYVNKKANEVEFEYLKEDILEAYNKYFYINFFDFTYSGDGYDLHSDLFFFFSQEDLNDAQLSFMIDTISKFFAFEISILIQENEKNTLYEILKIVLLYLYDMNRYEKYSFKRFLEDLDKLNDYLKKLKNINYSFTQNLGAYFKENDKQLKDKLKNNIRLELEDILFNDEISQFGMISFYFIVNQKDIDLFSQFILDLQSEKFEYLLDNETSISKITNKSKLELYNFTPSIKDSELLKHLGGLIIHLHNNKLYGGKRLIRIHNFNRKIDISSLINSSTIPIIFTQSHFMSPENLIYIKEIILMSKVDESHRSDFQKMKYLNNKIKVFEYDKLNI